MKYFDSRTEAATSFKEWLWLVKSPSKEIMGSNGRGKKKTQTTTLANLRSGLFKHENSRQYSSSSPEKQEIKRSEVMSTNGSMLEKRVVESC